MRTSHSHEALCLDCAQRCLDRCPLCRAPIEFPYASLPLTTRLISAPVNVLNGLQRMASIALINALVIALFWPQSSGKTALMRLRDRAAAVATTFALSASFEAGPAALDVVHRLGVEHPAVKRIAMFVAMVATTQGFRALGRLPLLRLLRPTNQDLLCLPLTVFVSFLIKNFSEIERALR